LKSVKYSYINDSKPRCQIFVSSHNNAKQPINKFVFLFIYRTGSHVQTMPIEELGQN